MKNFGGDHTELKLEVLEEYASMFCRALKNKGFKLIYIDCFAGEGQQKTKTDDKILGSVSRILQQNMFDKYYFIEKDDATYQNLKAITKDKGNSTAYHGDMNDILPEILRQNRSSKNRFLIFIDPFGLQLDFDILKKIKTLGKFDILFLLNLQAISRMIPLEQKRQQPAWKDTLTKIFGDRNAWESVYELKRQSNFLQEETEQERQSNISKIFLENYLNRVKILFPYYCDSIYSIKSQGNEFSLIYILNNDSDGAIGLAKEFVIDRLKKKYS